MEGGGGVKLRGGDREEGVLLEGKATGYTEKGF